jgi:hypothetical protein
MATFQHDRLPTTEFPTLDMDNDWYAVHDKSALAFHPTVNCHERSIVLCSQELSNCPYPQPDE